MNQSKSSQRKKIRNYIKDKGSGYIILIIAQVIVILLGIFLNLIWSKRDNYDQIKKTYELRIETLERTITDLKNILSESEGEKKEISMELTKSKKQVEDSLRHIPSERPSIHTSTQEFKNKIIDRYENNIRCDIDISFWPEVKGINLVIDGGVIYPLSKIQSICFSIVDGNAIMGIMMEDKSFQKHTVAPDFYNNRKVKIAGTIIKQMGVNEINCLIFKEL